MVWWLCWVVCPPGRWSLVGYPREVCTVPQGLPLPSQHVRQCVHVILHMCLLLWLSEGPSPGRAGAPWSPATLAGREVVLVGFQVAAHAMHGLATVSLVGGALHDELPQWATVGHSGPQVACWVGPAGTLWPVFALTLKNKTVPIEHCTC